ncbi:MAG: uridine phosphorylase [Ruminococcaceae bacterium]|nr:uridine phosphorylase [Oscillospiraceae bacterium]
MLDTKQKQYHIGVGAGEIGKYCILPGDPARCAKIAAHLEGAHHVSTNREYEIWNGTLEGETVTVCSTGIGGPSTAIAVEELAACGAETMIRVGTCGGISLEVCSGDIVIATGAVRQDGTSREYAPIEFPAVATADVLFSLVRSAKALGFKHHTGIVQSKDSFYGQHSPKRMPTASELDAKWTAWKRLGVLASEMEASTLFTVGASLGLSTGAVFLSVWNQERYDAGLDTGDDEEHDTERAIVTAIEAIRDIIKAEKNQ